MQLKNGATIANRYVVSGVLGTGGMAIVYKAKDIKLDRDVTLKVMREEFASDDDFINRFNVEAKAAAKLSHHNIVNVFDVGKHGDIYFIVMEYVDGVTLKDIIVNKGAFNNEELLGVAIQIASALEVAHKNNIVHRDIKPQNILVTVKGEVKVTDFGIARAVNANTVTAGNNTMGSVHYFSPEQARGGYIDQKSDIYSLGITMYEMATGEIPFDDENAVAIALKHISDELPDIGEKNAEIIQSVINIINKATSKVSSLRFESMEKMNNELKRALTNINNQESVEEGEIIDLSVDKSSTLLLSDSDVAEIRSRALTAFYDNADLDGENSFYDTLNDYEEEYTDEKSSDKLMIIAGIVTAFALILIIFFFVITYFKGTIPQVVDVPVLKGMTIAEARAETNSLGIEILEAKQSFSDTIPAGQIIKQNYESIQVGGTVEVEISLGTDKIEIPNTVGKDLDESIEIFDKLGFNIREEYIHDNNVELNKIVRQSPTGGTYGVNGDTVTLYVSKGRESVMITVPYLAGFDEESAKRKIEEVGLEYGGASSDYSDVYEAGLVIAQSPDVGTEVSNGGGKVGIVLSRGPRPEEPPAESEEATPAATEDSQVAQPVTNTRTFTIYPPAGVAEDESITVQLVQVASADGSQRNVYEETIVVSELPKQIEISGTGKHVFMLYMIEDGTSRLLGETEEMDFDSVD